MRSKSLQDVYEFAFCYARDNNLESLEPHHILYAMANTENEAKPLLKEFGVCPDKFHMDDVATRKGMTKESKDLDKVNVKAAYIASLVGSDEVNCMHMLLAILMSKDTYAYGTVEYCLNNDQKCLSNFVEAVVTSLPNNERLLSAAKPAGVATVTDSAEAATQTSVADDALQTLGQDLTERAANGGFDPVIGRDVETERVIQTLTRRTKNNPVLVGEAGVGKTAVVEGFATRIAQGRVPLELQGKHVIQLDLASLTAGTRFRGDFEERLVKIVSQATSRDDVILFIDEIHNLVGAGGTSDGAMDAAEILKPALARGELKIIGATTTREYKMYIEKDPALERRFQPITVAEPSPELAMEIVKGVRPKYESHHGVTISDDAIEAAVQLSVRYINDRYLPDKAFDIIDEACSKLKLTAAPVPRRLFEISNELKNVKRRLDSPSLDDQQRAALASQYGNLLQALENEQRSYRSRMQEERLVLTASDVRAVVSQMTGVPLNELSREEKDKLVNLERELGSRVIGQKEAVRVVARAVRRQRAGLKDPNRPIGSFIFVGPTGVGKTELAKALSECLFGANSEVIRLDMSEYMEKSSVAKLIGAPPGYVGYDESGYLTEKVLRRPYSVVLFDEVEKAHPDVFNLLLQILDEGRLTDSHGKTVDFRNTIIILTGNVGFDSRTNSIGFGNADDYENLHANVERALRSSFRPEFLNRLDEIVIFNYLSREDIEQIAQLLCVNLYKRLKGVLNLQFTSRAIKALAQDGYDKSYGARPLKRAIQRKVEDALAEKMLSGEFSRGDSVLVDSINGELRFVKLYK